MPIMTFLHTYDGPGSMARNEPREFLRLPVVGEYLAREFNGPWYEVTLVVHCPFAGEYAAEVYARKVDSATVLRTRGAWPKSGVVAPGD